MPSLRRILYGSLLSVLCFGSLLAAEDNKEQAALPEPLTLEQALAYAAKAHPDLLIAKSDIQTSKAEREQIEAENGLKTSIVARARYVDPNDETPVQGHDDNAISLIARKNLYDFGRTDARLAAADASIQSSRLAYLDEKNDRIITIMARFFDVILADMDFLRDNEAMAVGFIRFDRLSKRMELGQAREVDVLELETEFQKTRLARANSEARQRATRARLALAMNVPTSLPASLAEPELPFIKRKPPEFETIVKDALEHNNQVKRVQARLDSAREKLRAARAGDNPLLYGEALVQETARKLGSSDRARIGLTLEIPLTDGGTTKANVAKQLAEVHRWQAELQRTRYDIREQALALWLDLDRLRIERERAEKQMEYRDVALDVIRTEYELELRTELGNAMTNITAAQRDLAAVKFETALTWAKLHALMGRPVTISQPPQQVKP